MQIIKSKIISDISLLLGLAPHRLTTQCPGSDPVEDAEYLWINSRQIHNDGPFRTCGQQDKGTTVIGRHRILYTRDIIS